MDRIYAVVILYNGVEWVDKCIGGLINSSIQIKVLAIDNGSSDGTLLSIKQKYPEVTLIENTWNLGFGKAHNIAFKKILNEGADYIFLLNQDAWVERDTIERLVETQKKNQEYGILSPMQLNGWGTALDHQFSGYLVPAKTPYLYSDACLNNFKTIYSTGYVNAAAWLISIDCLRSVGGFDPIFDQYGEDDDYCKRTLYKEFKIGIVPDTRIYHDREGKTWKTILSDPGRLYVNQINRIKNVRYPFYLNLIGWMKMIFDKTTTYLIFFRLKEVKVHLVIFFRIMGQLSRIRKHYKICREEDCAFL